MLDQVFVSTILPLSQSHYYQPMWTLVGAGIKTTEQSRRRQKQCIPNGTTWLQTSVEGFEPERNSVSLYGSLKDKKVLYWNFIFINFFLHSGLLIQ